MSTGSQMYELSSKLALELIPKALAGRGIPESVTRAVLEALIGALQEQQNASDEKLRKLVGSYYQSGMDYLTDAKSLQGERREQWIKLALDRFVTASHVEDTILAAKSQYFVGVCYDLLNETQLARAWYERAGTSVLSIGHLDSLVDLGRWNWWDSLNKTIQEKAVYQRFLLQPLLNVLSPVLQAHHSTLSLTLPRAGGPASFIVIQGDLLMERRRYEEALAAFEEAIRLNPNYSGGYSGGGAQYGKGAALFYLKRYEEALTAFEQAIRLKPSFAPAYHNKGSTLVNLRRYQEALTAYEEAIRLNPNEALNYEDKAIVLERLGRNNEAQQFHAKARQLGYK